MALRVNLALPPLPRSRRVLRNIYRALPQIIGKWLTDEEARIIWRIVTRAYYRKRKGAWMTDCRKKGCGRQAECFVAYDYVSGARGNIARNEKPYCREHAQAVIDSKMARA